MTIKIRAFLHGYMGEKTAVEEINSLDMDSANDFGLGRFGPKDMDSVNDFGDVFKFKTGPAWARPSRGQSDYHIQAEYMKKQKKRRERLKPQIDAARKKMSPEGVASDRYHRGEFPGGFQQYIEEAGRIGGRS